MSAVLTNAIHSGPNLRGRVSSLDVGVAASVALHAVLLFAVAGAQDVIRWQPVLPGPLVARLVAVEPEVEKPAPAPKAEPLPAPAPAVAKPEPGPAPVVAEERSVVPQPAPPVLARSEPAASGESATATMAAAPAPAEPQPVSAEPQGLAVVRPPEPRIERPDPRMVAQYRGALISAARRYKIYPRVAIDNNWEGRVEVRMVIGAAGSIASMRVTASAGYEVLDAQALEMIRRAWPEAQLPLSLRGREFAVDVPVIFSLRDPSA